MRRFFSNLGPLQYTVRYVSYCAEAIDYVATSKPEYMVNQRCTAAVCSALHSAAGSTCFGATGLSASEFASLRCSFKSNYTPLAPAMVTALGVPQIRTFSHFFVADCTCETPADHRRSRPFAHTILVRAVAKHFAACASDTQALSASRLRPSLSMFRRRAAAHG